MIALVDTNILVYRFDPRFPDKQRKAIDVLRHGVEQRTIRVPHQAVIEFYAAVTRPLGNQPPRLSPQEAKRETEAILLMFDILYPTEAIVRLALRAVETYQLSWFDAHLLAYAEYHGIEEVISEDFQHGRVYGTVRVRNPLL